jgi:predicted transcriptional regulator
MLRQEIISDKNNVSSQYSSSIHGSTERRNKKEPRSDLEIIASILKGASLNGGQSITWLKQKSNLSSQRVRKYVDYMVATGLLSVTRSSDNDMELYRPTELGYDYVLKQRELVVLLDSDDEKDLFHFWD